MRSLTGSRVMPGHGSKFSRKKEQAIEALIAHRGPEEAARAVGIGTTTLSRWKKDPEFDAAYRAAKRAAFGQTNARLRHLAMAAAATLLRVMIDPGARASTRLQAAILVRSHAQDAREMEDFAAALSEVECAAKTSNTEGAALPASQRASWPIAGHGAKFGRKKEEAIAQLLAQRSVAEAARAADVGTTTLYRWIEDPEFAAAYLAAARATFGPAMTLLQQGASAAVTTIGNIMNDPALPAATRLQAADYVYSYTKAVEMEDQRARVAEAEAESGSAGNGEPGGTSKMIGRSLHQRVQQLKACLLPANWLGGIGVEYVHAADGRPSGPVSVIGPGGGQVWLEAPDGCKPGEAVQDPGAA
jgi:DNA invertase Pin-like site-specific DNA recombinase